MKNSILALGTQSQLDIEEDDEEQEKSEWQKKYRVKGQKPQARDGHTSTVYGTQMIVFGGDRHKMSFHDLFGFNLDKILL